MTLCIDRRSMLEMDIANLLGPRAESGMNCQEELILWDNLQLLRLEVRQAEPWSLGFFNFLPFKQELHDAGNRFSPRVWQIRSCLV